MRKASSGFKYVAIIMMLVLFYFAYTIHGQRAQIKELSKALEEKTQQAEHINYKISELEKEIEDSGSLKFVERIARDEYGMVKPKEVIFVDKDREEAAKPFNNK